MKWIGPYKIDELLDSFLILSKPRPPESDSVYFISKKMWQKEPTNDCYPIYVGSNTGKSKRFITRIGDLIADMFGFFGTETGHHSGGITINCYCKENNINPKLLYIGWLKECDCVRCAEYALYQRFKQTLLNKKRPPKCIEHSNG